MKKILVYVLAAAVLFTVSATVSLWLSTKRTDDDHSKAVASAADSKLDEADKALQAKTLKDRETAVAEHEKQLARREQTVKLVLDDLHKERTTLDDLRKQMAADLKTLSDKLAAVEAARDKLARDQARPLPEIEQAKHETSVTGPAPAPAPVPVVRTVFDYDSMEPSSAATRLRDMVHKGSYEEAVKILAAMKKKQADSVVAEMKTIDRELAAWFEQQAEQVRRAAAAPMQ
jgi:hypothetical protein